MSADTETVIPSSFGAELGEDSDGQIFDDEINQALDKLTSDEIEKLLHELSEEGKTSAAIEGPESQKDQTLGEETESNVTTLWDCSHDSTAVDVGDVMNDTNEKSMEDYCEKNIFVENGKKEAGDVILREVEVNHLQIEDTHLEILASTNGGCAPEGIEVSNTTHEKEATKDAYFSTLNREVTLHPSYKAKKEKGVDNAAEFSIMYEESAETNELDSPELPEETRDNDTFENTLKKSTLVSNLGIFAQNSFMSVNPLSAVISKDSFSGGDVDMENDTNSTTSEVSALPGDFCKSQDTFQSSVDTNNLISAVKRCEIALISQPIPSTEFVEDHQTFVIMQSDDSISRENLSSKKVEEQKRSVIGEADSFHFENFNEQEDDESCMKLELSKISDHLPTKPQKIEDCDEYANINESYLDDSIYSFDEYNQHSNVLSDDFITNPVQEELKLEPVVKELMLDPISRRGTNTTNDNSILELEDLSFTAETIDSKDVQMEQWIRQDDKQLFSPANTKEALETSQILCDLDGNVDYKTLASSKVIYISQRLTDVVGILRCFSIAQNYEEEKIEKKILYLDFSLEDLHDFKCFNDTIVALSKFRPDDFFIQNLEHIEVKIKSHNHESAMCCLEILKTLGSHYHCIKVLGLFQLQSDSECISSCSSMVRHSVGMLKLPSSLEKLVLANGIDLDDNISLNATLRSVSIYCTRINLSKFNVTRKLEQLQIYAPRTQDFEIVKKGRTEQFLAGLTELKRLKITSQLYLGNNFEKNSKLQSLTLAGLDFKMTRSLRLPQSLRTLCFENCSISSHLVAFPPNLRRLSVIGGRWKEQRILTFTNLKELHIENVEVNDLMKKVNFARGLVHLRVIQCKVKSFDEIRFPKSLRHADFSFNTIESINGIPDSLVTLNLEANLIQKIEDQAIKKLVWLKELNLNQNKLSGKFEVPSNVEMFTANYNVDLTSAALPKTIKTVDLSHTGITNLSELILGRGDLQTISLDGCMLSSTSFEVGDNVVELSLSDCYISDLELKFAPKSVLKKLDLSGNHLRQFDSFYWNDTVIGSLNLSRNHISSVDCVHWPQKLRSLDLSENVLDGFKGPLPSTARTLNLSKNKVVDFTELKLPSGLKELDLSHNPLSGITSRCSAPVSLQKLHLESCHLASFEMEIPSALVYLNLSNNKLHHKSFELYCQAKAPGTRSQRMLDLRGNYFKEINFDTLHGTPLTFLQLSNNMFDQYPSAMPAEVSAAVFNDVPGSFLRNF